MYSIKKSQGNITAVLGYYIIKISEYENCKLNITNFLNYSLENYVTNLLH